MGLSQIPPVFASLATTCLVALAIGVPLAMQNIMIPHNEACFGPWTPEDTRALLTVRYQTWATSLVVTGLSILTLCWLHRARMWRVALIFPFVIWKAAALFFDTFGSPICWEPYANDTPFWDEPIGTGLAFYAQPLAFCALSLALIVLALSTWFRLVAKHRPPR